MLPRELLREVHARGRGALGEPEEAAGSVNSKEGSAGRTPERLKVAGGLWCSVAGPDAMATIADCFNNRDMNIYVLHPIFYK